MPDFVTYQHFIFIREFWSIALSSFQPLDVDLAYTMVFAASKYIEKITPLQRDPKQQELRILLRPRWIYDPMKDSGKASFDQGS